MFNQWKWLSFGIGVVVGAVGATVIASRPSYIKDGATTVLSHGLTAKRKLQAIAGSAKENLEDLVAEADQKAQDRANAKAESQA
ncbi:MAG: hypothetical protein LBP95_08430 [Deltaproteobacteria bacterium]|jgi:hypothetical protein|nr:hypothetical protein [Deltaproteobacteria bacterium]MDR1297286.1 hypothetical protein [Deltaproteobacteria bacterium]